MKKLWSLMLAGVICLSMLSGCGGKANTSYTAEEEAEHKGKLQVNFYGINGEVIVDEYNAHAAEGELAWANHVGLDYYQQLEYPNLAQDVMLDLMSQKAPDLYCFGMDYGGLFRNLINNNAFADLNPIMKKDKELDLSEYQEKVLDLGVKDGKRLFVPMSYSVDLFYITQENLDGAEFKEDPVILLENLPTILEQIQPRDMDPIIMLNGIFPYIFPNIIWGDYVNPNQNTTSFTSEAFKKTIKGYAEYDKWIYDSGAFKRNDWSFNNYQLFRSGYSSAPMNINEQYYNLQGGKQGALRVFGLRDANNPQGYRATASNVFAISKRCKQKDKAYQMIKYYMSEECQQQSAADSNSKVIAIPIHKKAWETKYQKDLGQYTKDREDFAAFAQEYRDIVENVTSYGIFYDIRYMNSLFNPLYEEYKNGKLSLDEFSSQLDNKTKIFLTE